MAASLREIESLELPLRNLKRIAPPRDLIAVKFSVTNVRSLVIFRTSALSRSLFEVGLKLDSHRDLEVIRSMLHSGGLQGLVLKILANQRESGLQLW